MCQVLLLRNQQLKSVLPNYSNKLVLFNLFIIIMAVNNRYCPAE